MAFPHVAPLIWQNLPHTVTLQVMRSIRDSLGGDQKHWQTVRTMRGFMQEISRKEKMEFQGRLSECTHRFYHDNSIEISQEHRIVFISREFKVLAVSAATVNLYPSLNAALCVLREGDIDADDPS